MTIRPEHVKKLAARMRVHIDNLRSDVAIAMAYDNGRAAALEEAAKLVEREFINEAVPLAAAIRALKEST